MGCASSHEVAIDPPKPSADVTPTAEPPKPVPGPPKPAPKTSEPAAKPPAPKPPAAPAAIKWYEVPLDDTLVVVRKECRKMPAAEQERVAAAVIKMRENDDGVAGTSQFFRLAVIHGGMPPLSDEKYPEYCAHRRECFPNWHRPYLLEFERTLRRADIALGGDGNIGLPYWDWSQTDVQGEVLPRILREKMMVEFADDFFPVKPNPGAHAYRMSATNSDEVIAQSLVAARVSESANACLLSTAYKSHATTKYQTNRSPSLENPHNMIHGIVGGIMASYQSSFHPVFWMHHNNVERISTKYLEMEPDSMGEFEQHQASLSGGFFSSSGQRGFPEGPWGPYEPFTHHKTGKPFHAADTFVPTTELGFQFDELPTPLPPQMREAPYLAVFSKVDVTKMEKMTRLLFVYVSDATSPTPWSPPAATGREALMQPESGFAGLGSVWFIDSPAGCENCVKSPTYDIYVDVTHALRAHKISPKHCQLHVMVENGDGTIQPIEQTPVHAYFPTLKGPRFSSLSSKLAEGVDETSDTHQPLSEQVEELQRLLSQTSQVAGECALTGVFDEATKAIVTSFQQAAGLEASGEADEATKRALVVHGLAVDDELLETKYSANSTVTWSLAEHTLPSSLLGQASVQAITADLAAAFAVWAAPTGITFVQVPARATEAPGESGAQICVSFGSQSASNEFAFDGPGGSLAKARPDAIKFDEEEKWELTGKPHPHRKVFDWDEQYFQLLPVAIHEVGHVLGLSHSEHSADVMSPFYVAGQVTLSENDVTRVKALLGIE